MGPPPGKKTGDSDPSEEIFLDKTSLVHAPGTGAQLNLPNGLFAGIIHHCHPASNMWVAPEDFRHLAFHFDEIVGVVQNRVCDCAVMRQERGRNQCANQAEKSVGHVHHLFVPRKAGADP